MGEQHSDVAEAQRLNGLGHEAFGRGDEVEALEFFERSADVGDSNSAFMAYCLLAVSQDRERAESYLDRSIALGSGVGAFARGQDLLAAGELEAGEQLLLMAVERGAPQAKSFLAEYWGQVGRVEEAVDLAESGLDDGDWPDWATFTWLCLLAGDSERACARMDALVGSRDRDRVAVTDLKMANVFSNDALNRLACRGEVVAARRMWGTCGRLGLAEARAFQWLLAERLGEPLPTDWTLDEADRADLVPNLRDAAESALSDTWAEEWLSATAELLANPQNQPTFAPPVIVPDTDEVAGAVAFDPASSPAEVSVYVVEKYTYGGGRMDMLVTRNPIVRDLVAAGLLSNRTGGPDEWQVLGNTGVLDADNVDPRYDGECEFIGWIGSSEPPWWNDWTSIDDWLGDDVRNGLVRGFYDEMDFGGPDVEAAALSGRGVEAQGWTLIALDLRTVLNVDTPQEQVEEVADRWLDGDLGAVAGERLARVVVGALARHPSAPVSVLQRLADSDDVPVRWLVTRNRSASPGVLRAAHDRGVDGAAFEAEVPAEDWLDVYYEGIHLSAAVNSYSLEEFREQYPDFFEDPDAGWFTDQGELQYDSRAHADTEGLFYSLASNLLSVGPFGYITHFQSD